MFKLTKLEKYWVLYDVGNSAFTLLMSTIIPIYFNYLAKNQNISAVDYLAYWGYAASLATIIVAVLGPIFGTIADNKDFKKILFLISIFIGVISCVLLGFASVWLVFLAIFILAKVGFSSSLIFYDSMLVDVTKEERMDIVSSQGYAWGYIGSCIPFITSLSFVLGYKTLGISMEQSMIIAFFIVALWWFILSIPLIRNYKQKNYVEKKPNAVRESFHRLGKTIKSIRREKHIFIFLLAFFFYIDGVYTVIDMATAYGAALGLDDQSLLLALLVTQFVAFPCTIVFGRLTQKILSEKLIMVCIVAYLGIVFFATFISAPIHFWILAILVGMFQGGIQALSRAYYARIIPNEKSGEYFGILDICGKGASFLGTTLVGAISQVTGNINIGVGSISIFFVVGFILFRKAALTNKVVCNLNLIHSETI